MISGRIELYGKDGRMIASSRYLSVRERYSAIDAWKRRYPTGYDKCYYIIIPVTDYFRVTDNGENWHKRGHKRKPINYDPRRKI